jgi:predicted nucleic acid-binding Zn ribbon protein
MPRRENERGEFYGEQEVEMSSYCRVCGRPMEEGRGDICEVCQESIRAEAMGRQRKITKDVPRGAAKLKERAKEPRAKDKKNFPQPHDKEGEKKPHHFKSMAEYLEYLKGKE